MHETLGTPTSPDTTDGVPRVICRFGKVVYNIASFSLSTLLVMSLHSLPSACIQGTLQGHGATIVHKTLPLILSSSDTTIFVPR